MNYMKDKRITTTAMFLAVAISALMLVAPALASHTQSAEWKETGDNSYTVPKEKEMVTTITVTNDSGDAIENIQIVGDIDPRPTGDVGADELFYSESAGRQQEGTTGIGKQVSSETTKTITLDHENVLEITALEDNSIGTLNEDNYEVEINEDSKDIKVTNTGNSDFTVDNVYYLIVGRESDGGDSINETREDSFKLPAGTEVTLNQKMSVTLVENTDFLIPEGERVYYREEDENVGLNENGIFEITADENIDNLMGNPDNVETIEDYSITFDTDGVTVRLLEDTSVMPRNENVFSMLENTKFELVNKRTVALNNIVDADNLKLKNDKELVGENFDNENTFRATQNVDLSLYDSIPEGKLVEVYGSTSVIAQAGTKFNAKTTSSVSVIVSENTEVIKQKDDNLEIKDPAAFTSQPEGWMGWQKDDHPEHGVKYVQFDNKSSDDTLDAGSSLDVPLAINTGSEDHNVYVRTTDTDGVTRITTLNLNVDTTNPSVEDLTVSPEWAGENQEVDITIEMSETLADAPDVAVKENNGEFSPLSVEGSQDNTVYEGVYTTGDNTDRDGLATIRIENYEDVVGNEEIETMDNDDLLNIDRVAPDTPSLDEISDWPTDGTAADNKQTNVTGYLWETTASDNYANYETALSEGSVHVKYEGEWHPVGVDSAGYWNSEIDLNDGTYEIGVKYVDRAGNESGENLENITIDTTAPSVTNDSDFGDGDYITDNQPTVSLQITDEGVGIENITLTTASGYEIPVLSKDSVDNGYQVMLVTPEFAEAVVNGEIPSTSENIVVYDVEGDSEENAEVVVLSNEMTYDRHDLSFQNSMENVFLPGVTDSEEIELKEETYSLLVIAGDNLQSENAAYEFTVDTTSPNFVRNDVYYTEDSEGMRHKNGGVTTKTKTWTWSGESYEEGSTIIMTNADGEELGSAVVNEDKEWDIEVTFNEDGRRTIFFQEVDRAGNTSEKIRWGTFAIDTTKPSIEFSEETKALDGTETNESSIDIKATITDEIAEPNDDLLVRVSAPNYDMPEGDVTLGDEGVLDIDVPLEEGPNTIKVTAVDGTNNVATDSIKVTRTVAPWAMYATIAAIIAIILAALAILRRQ